MFRWVIGALAILISTSAPADHKAGHNPGGGAGGGDGSTTLGDLNCTAGQIAKFNGAANAWECSQDEIGGGAYLVVDSSNQVIRHTNIDRFLSSAVISVDVQYAGETVSVLHEVDANGVSADFAESISYETADCSGQPWFRPLVLNGTELPPPPPSAPMLPGWRYSEIIIDPFASGGPNFDAKLIFLADWARGVIDVHIGSLFDADGNCVATNATAPFSIPITEDQFTDFRDDLHVLHPPPYRVCAIDDSNCIDGVAGP